jgi:hypothetical protein
LPLGIAVHGTSLRQQLCALPRRWVDRVRQQSILYVGPYESIDDALHQIPRVSRYWRDRATLMDIEWMRAEAEADADALDERLGKLRRLVEEHPDLVEQDRARVQRQRT